MKKQVTKRNKCDTHAKKIYILFCAGYTKTKNSGTKQGSSQHIRGKLLFAKLMGKMLGGKKKGEKAKPMGFEVNADMMSMMNGFTVLRLLTLMGGMMDAKFTKEDLLALNTKLSRIREPKKKK